MNKIVAILVMLTAIAMSSPSHSQDSRYENPSNWQDPQCYQYYKRFIAYRAGRNWQNGGFDPKTTLIVSYNTVGKLWCFVQRASTSEAARKDLAAGMRFCKTNQWARPETCNAWLSYQNN